MYIFVYTSIMIYKTTEKIFSKSCRQGGKSQNNTASFLNGKVPV